MAFSLAVNFQPAGSFVPAGYLADSGQTYADRGNGFTYGWNYSNATTRDRNSSASPDQRYDTLIHTQATGSRTWELAVPNGQYQVKIVAGDPGYTDSVYGFDAEGANVVSGTPTSSNRWIEGTRTVTVSDGKLTIDNASGSINNKIAFVQINGLDGPAPDLPSLPGTIQAEDFDDKGAGVSYSDTTSANLGKQYRNTAVDIVTASEGGYAVGYTRPGEWLNYTVNVETTGSYDLELRVASATGGLFQLAVDGQTTGASLALPSTGGWQNWKTIRYPAVALSAGTHTLKLLFVQANGSGDIGNVNWLRLSAGSDPALPTVSLNATDASASEPGTNTGRFTFTRTGSTASALSINYTVGGSASNGVDYNTLGGSIVIPAGAASATLNVVPKDDGVVEFSETVRLTIANSSAYQVGVSNDTVTITDNDAPASDGQWPRGWTVANPLPRARHEARGGTIDGKVWVFGGFYSGSTLTTQQIDYYNVATNTWTKLRDYGPMPHTHAPVAVDEANGAFYFVGGLFGNFPGDTTTDKVFRFDARTQTWSQPLPSLPEPLSSGGAAIVGGKLHYFGGSKADRITDSGRHLVIDLNNPSAGWKDAPPLPNPRTHLSAAVLDGKIYAIGGQHDHDKHPGQLADVHRFDPATQTWTRLANLPTPKSHAETSTFAFNGRIIMAGGQVGRFGATDEVVSYDPDTNRWTTLGKLPTPLASGFVQLSGDKIIVTAGNHGDGSPNGETWVGEVG